MAAVLELSPDPVITIEHRGRVVDINRAARDAFGYDRNAAFGREFVDLIASPRRRERMRQRLISFCKTGRGAFFDKRLRGYAKRSSGSEFPVEFEVRHLPHAIPPMFAIYVRDLTESVRAKRELAHYQQRLRSLSAEVLVAEERERRCLAADLHDGLTQTMALIGLKLSELRESADPTLGVALDDLQALVLDANRTARSITFELSPPILHDLGLSPAVQWLVDNIQIRYGLDIAFDDDNRTKLVGEKTKVILFRAIRELLINAAKHSGTRRVQVCLWEEENWVMASVHDNGVGMDLDRCRSGGMGLFSIRERLDHVGGSLRIESAPGRGTMVCLSAPVAQKVPASRLRA